MTVKNSNHIPRIDVLRAIAILLVFTAHFDAAIFGAKTVPDVHTNLFRKIYYFILFDGNRGVVLFFVISGLCIRLSQRAQSSFSVSHFYWRRFWRIYPSYLIALFTFALVQHAAINDVLAHVFMVHNFWLSLITSINAPFWSLALEFQIYLMYPLLLLLHGRFGARATFTVLFLLVLASYAGVWAVACLHLQLPVVIADPRQLPTSLWLTWYTGFLVADRLIDKKPVTWQRRCILLATVCLAPVIKYHPQLIALTGPVDGIMMSLLVEEFLHCRLPASRIGKWLGLVGASSYSIYLYFDPLRTFLLNMLHRAFHFPGPRGVYMICYPVVLLLTVAFSYATYRLIELPGIAVGRSLYAGFLRRKEAQKSREVCKSNPEP